MTETVGIRDLKSRLSLYVKRAHAGETVLVTARGRPVALLTPLGAPTVLDRLIAEGLATRPTGHRSLPRLVEAAGTASDLVHEQRR